MGMDRALYRLSVGCLLALCGLGGVARAQDASAALAAQQALANTVLSRLLATAQAERPASPAYGRWPPTVTVDRDDKLNAYATAIPDCSPQIHMTSGLMDQALLDDQDRVALVLGHELSHVLLGHTQCGQAAAPSAFVANAYSREKEFAADKLGVELMLAAGFSKSRGWQALNTLDQLQGYSTLDALALDHPSTTERLAALDMDRASLWHAMSAFDLGNSFLATEQYRLAAASFLLVTQQYSDAWDAWNNLGYARLMTYADGLRPDDIADMQLGQVAAGGYFKTAETLRTKARGRDVTTWQTAIDALSHAAMLKPDSALIQANLGLAFTMAPQTAAVTPATTYLQKAISLEGAGSDGAAESRVGEEINLSVAYMRLGNVDEARRVFSQATQEYKQIGEDDREGGQFAIAYLFNQGMEESESNAKEELLAAQNSLMEYMGETGQDSPWQPAAYAAYTAICAKNKSTPKLVSAFWTAASLRPVVSLEAQSMTVYLGQQVDAVIAKFGPGIRSTVAPMAGLDRISYPAAGFEVIAESNVVTAIVSSGAAAMPVTLQSAALGGGTTATLRVGMNKDAWLAATQGQQYEEADFVDPGEPYCFLPDLGIALREAADGSLAEIVIVQTARPQATGGERPPG